MVEAATAKALESLVFGDMQPWQELELVSALDLGTIPWTVPPVALKQALQLPLADSGIDSLALNLSVSVQAKNYGCRVKRRNNASTSGTTNRTYTFGATCCERTVPQAKLTNFYYLSTTRHLGQHVKRLIVATTTTTELPDVWQRSRSEQRHYSEQDLETWRHRARRWVAEQNQPERMEGSAQREATASSLVAELELWPHQKECMGKCLRFLADPGRRNFFVQVATGGGKCRIIAELLAKSHTTPDDKRSSAPSLCCVVVPKLDLME